MSASKGRSFLLWALPVILFFADWGLYRFTFKGLSGIIGRTAATELYVLGMLLVACFSWWNIGQAGAYVAAAVLLLAAVRLAELVSRLLQVVLIDTHRDQTIESVPRSIVLTGLNFIEVTAWFAAVYSVLVSWQVLRFDETLSPLAYFHESLNVMTLNGLAANKLSDVAYAVSIAQSVIGLLLIGVMLSFFINALPSVRSRQ